MIRKVFILFILSIVLIGPVQSQDPYFSQFYNSSLVENPALTGVFNGQYRFTTLYRDQWFTIDKSNPINTFHASSEFRYNVLSKDYAALGLDLNYDIAGKSRFEQKSIGFTFSYLKNLHRSKYKSGNQFLAIGARAGIGQYAIDFSQLSFPNQYEVGILNFNAGIPNFENIGNSARSNFITDVNVGMLYYNVLGDNLSFYLGWSGKHLLANRIQFKDRDTQISLTETTDNVLLYRHWVAQGGAEFPIADQLSIIPAFISNVQGNAVRIAFGSHIRFQSYELKDMGFRFGTWLRLANHHDGIGSESIIVSAMLEINTLQIGLSYDFTISKLRYANQGNGAFEISLKYIIKNEFKYRSVTCPRF